MAYSQSLSTQSIHYHDAHPRRHASKQRFVPDLSQCLFDFVIQLLPTTEEMAVKEDVRKLLERLIRTIEPDSRLLSFGSTANGFSLRNSDMDLCCLIDSPERLAATDLVTMLGDLLERETKFHVKPLPHARIPIVKLSLDPSPGLPLGIACDIGFENRLALENTRLLMCYATIDPTRVRTMVLFLKVWSKRRKINSPYKGTLSSYGYVLLVIYFLVHVKNPPVLPNLQQMPPLRPISNEETHLNGYNTWFFDDIDLVRQRWHSDNTETVAELLIDFFRYYSRDFSYNTGVASIRAGLLKKEPKGWQNDLSNGRYNDSRERNRLCIEDPFETDYNVARCVTKDGLYTIRGEFMRAARILAARPERAIVALAELCEERKDEDLVSAPPYIAPRLSGLPPQVPYSVGSHPARPKGVSAPSPECLSPTTKFFEQGTRPSPPVQASVSIRPPPEHMAPKRGKWTSPPPAEAPSADHTLFESQLGRVLQLATSSTEAREMCDNNESSSSNSEFLTDEELDPSSDAAEWDDVTSVKSFTEGEATAGNGDANGVKDAPQRRPSWHTQDRVPQSSLGKLSTPSSGSGGRVRLSRPNDTSPSQSEISKRTIPDPSRARPSWSSTASSNNQQPMDVPNPPPPSPSSSAPSPHNNNNNNNNQRQDNIGESSTGATVYYQTTVPRSPRVLYPTSSFLAQYQSHNMYHNRHNIDNNNSIPTSNDVLSSSLPYASASIMMNPRLVDPSPDSGSAGPDTPTPYSTSGSHSHSLSSTTITSSTPPPHAAPLKLAQSASTRNIPNGLNLNPSSRSTTSNPNCGARSRSRSKSPIRRPPQYQFFHPHTLPQLDIDPDIHDTDNTPSSPHPSSGSSPTPSTSTGYATSISRSPSPISPAPPATATPFTVQKETEKKRRLVFGSACVPDFEPASEEA